eukprot:scaffold446873_cov17-Prasinocladus_malaysianus.AAC.1
MADKEAQPPLLPYAGHQKTFSFNYRKKEWEGPDDESNEYEHEDASARTGSVLIDAWMEGPVDGWIGGKIYRCCTIIQTARKTCRATDR